MTDHDPDVTAVLAEALLEEAWKGRWSPLDETNLQPLVGITVPVVLAALAAENFIIFKVPDDLKIEHGARLVRTLHACSACRDLYAIEARPEELDTEDDELGRWDSPNA